MRRPWPMYHLTAQGRDRDVRLGASFPTNRPTVRWIVGTRPGGGGRHPSQMTGNRGRPGARRSLTLLAGRHHAVVPAAGEARADRPLTRSSADRRRDEGRGTRTSLETQSLTQRRRDDEMREGLVVNSWWLVQTGLTRPPGANHQPRSFPASPRETLFPLPAARTAQGAQAEESLGRGSPQAHPGSRTPRTYRPPRGLQAMARGQKLAIYRCR
jgi:hypothetical protein